MKKVMVYAYVNSNLGDDLFIKVLCERYPSINFVLYSQRKYKLYFNKMNNMRLLSSDSIITRGINFVFRKTKINNNIIRRLIANSCDLAVYIGGSLFIQEGNWKSQLKDMKGMRIKNKPFFILGANFGPFKDNEFYFRYKEIFQEYTDICFREKYSFDLFKELGNVRVASDIIFQLEKKNTPKQEHNIVISVIKPSIRKHLIGYDEIYYKKIKDIAINFIEKGYNVTLMSFCENEGDEEAIEAIMSLIPKLNLNKVTKHLYKLNIEETLNVIARSNFVVATRFHSMIIGWVYNKPVFPIVYSEKMTNVMEDVGFNGAYTYFNNISNLEPEQVFESMKTNLIDVSKQVKDAEKHFEKLDEYLLK